MFKIKNWFYLPSFHYLILLVAVLGSCSNSEGKHQGNQPQQTNVVAEKMDNSIENNVTFQDGNGKLIALNDLKGKVVFINFWATWCPPCIQEMPSINELKAKFEGNENIVFLMVDVDGKHQRSQAFMDKRKYNFSVYFPHSEIPKEYLAGAIPTTVILDKKGAIAARIEGGRDYSLPEIFNGLRKLLEK